MDSLEKHKVGLKSLILEIAQKYLPQIELLLTVPSIHDTFTAIRILTEVSTDDGIRYLQAPLFLAGLAH